jgi:hypothetical protein
MVITKSSQKDENQSQACLSHGKTRGKKQMKAGLVTDSN